jgi:hypothetical protein
VLALALEWRAWVSCCFSAGIPEDLVLSQMEVAAPQSVRDVLQALVADGIVSVRLLTPPASASAPPAIFGCAGGRPVADAETGVGRPGGGGGRGTT